MTREEAIEYWEQFNAEIDDLYDACSDADRDVLVKQREIVEYTISALRQQETMTKCTDLYDEDGGEIPLNAKTMTLDDAIAHLDDTLSDTARKWSCESCRMEHLQLRSWLAELRDIKRKRNEPLTLDELRQLPIRDWVWIEILNPDAFRSKETVSAYYRKYDGYKADEIFWCGYPGLGFGFDYADYGKTWLAYRQKPEEGTV